MGIPQEGLENYGNHIAKIDERLIDEKKFTDHWATRMGEFNDPDDPYMMTDIKPFGWIMGTAFAIHFLLC